MAGKKKRNGAQYDFGRKFKVSWQTMDMIVKHLGVHWERILNDNPYKLMEFGQFGFFRCDTIAKKLGYDMKSPNRIKAYVQVAIEQEANGSTVLEISKVLKKIKQGLELDDVGIVMKTVFKDNSNPNEKTYLLLDENFKRMDGFIGAKYITTKEWFEIEQWVFTYLRNLSKKQLPNKKENLIEIIKNRQVWKLNDEQSIAVDSILDKNITLLIGKGGCGKSFVTKVILDVLDAHGYTYSLMTPTGIASANLTEKTGRESITIHSRYYNRNEDWDKPDPYMKDFLIIDEIGMCGVDHFKMFMEMINVNKKAPRILFIGDKWQLGSISAGDFLSSIMKMINMKSIDGQIIELTKIMRASSESFIPYFCGMFCDNSRLDLSILNEEHKGVEFYKRQEDVISQVSNIIKAKEWKWDETAIILPQRVGNVGCNSINDYFQYENNNEVIYKDEYNLYKRNDVLMHIKNNKNLGIYNGERINLLEYNDDKGVFVCERVQDNNIFEYYKDVFLTETMLSNANTIFKLQGCTVKNVIFMCLREHTYMLSRNVIYTSLSRASKNLVMVYDEDALRNGSTKTTTDKRDTFLGKICEMRSKK